MAEEDYYVDNMHAKLLNLLIRLQIHLLSHLCFKLYFLHKDINDGQI